MQFFSNIFFKIKCFRTNRKYFVPLSCAYIGLDTLFWQFYEVCVDAGPAGSFGSL